MSFQSSSLDDPISEENHNEDLFTTADYNSVNNANLLRDIESLIQNMERKQTQDNDSLMLQNIDNILSNIKLNESRPHSPQSNLSAEPIRMKSPIMLPSRNDDKIKNDVHNIIDNIRSFVSNNIQDIVPELVSQVEQELTTDLNDEVNEIMLANLDEFLRMRHDAEFEEGKVSPQEIDISQALGLEDFLRSRHDEEFAERNISPTVNRTEQTYLESHISIDESDNGNDDFHEFFRNRQDEEYQERNDDTPKAVDASHDSISMQSQESASLNNRNLIVAAPLSTNENELNVGSAVNSEIASHTVTNETPALNEHESNLPDATANSQQLEPLKYKSSYNLKILKHPARRPKSERDFKKRNSLILENVLLGRKAPSTSKKIRPTSLALNEPVELGPVLNDLESNINHHASLINENIERKSEENLNEINASGNREKVEIKQNAEDSISNINGSVQADVQNESLLLLENENASNENSVIETTIEAVVEVINDEGAPYENIINGIDGQRSGKVTSDFHLYVNDETNQSFPESGSSTSLLNENDLSKAPQSQNLSALVEDTQRLIKQMKDEINAIYVSDEEFTSSEGTGYSDDSWAEGMNDGEIEDEYTDEESEYEEWSGDFIESETAPEDTLMIESLVDDPNSNNVDTEDNNELLDTLIIGEAPSAVNEPENAEAEAQTESVVHGKLELMPMSSNEFRVDANVGNENDSASASLNDNDGNLNNSTNLQIQEANEKMVFQVASTSEASSGTELINYEIVETTNSIKGIVKDAINDVISTISFDEPENIVERGNDNHDSQIAGGSLQPHEHDSTNIDSAMNNSENISAEVTSKISDGENDSITSGNMLNDDGNVKEIISASIEEASNAEIEESTESNGGEKANQLSNDVVTGEEIRGDVETDAHDDSEEPIEPNNHVGTAGVETMEPSTQIENAHSMENSNEPNQKVKGAVAKTKIPAKIKANKGKSLATREADKLDEAEDDSPKSSLSSKSKSSTPEKIKEPFKRQDNADSTNTQEKSPKQAQTNRKSSFDSSSRKKSVGASPFGLLASSNVKSLQKEFMNKSNIATAPKAQPTKVKPSKLVPPKALTKELTSTFANKLTRLITPSSSGKSNSDKSNHVERPKEFLRDHSKDVVPEKKYLEHCFSDEYPTTTDDEDEEEMKAPKSFFNIIKPPARDSDDETSDVGRISQETFFFLNKCQNFSLRNSFLLFFTCSKKLIDS